MMTKLTMERSVSFSKASRVGIGGIALVALTFAASPVYAKALAGARNAQVSAPNRAVADNVVVTPGSQTAPAQPAPTVVVPQTTTQPAQAAVVQEPAKRTEVHAEASSPHNYMTTIAVSALMGALTGGLVGGAIYYLGDRQNGINIAYWAAGGVLLGTGVGIAQIMVQETRVSNATASRFPSDPAPTYRLSLLNVRF